MSENMWRRFVGKLSQEDVQAMGKVKLKQEDCGKVVVAHVGDVVTIELPENPSTGSLWIDPGTRRPLVRVVRATGEGVIGEIETRFYLSGGKIRTSKAGGIHEHSTQANIRSA
jgi:hypothetical protein